MDKDQLIIHGIVNNSIGSRFNELSAIKRKHQLDIQKIIENRIQKLVPLDFMNDESLSLPITIIAEEIIQFFERESQFTAKSLNVKIKSIIDKVLNQALSLGLDTCICCIQVDDNISFKDLTDLAVAIERLHEYTGLSMPDIECIQIRQQQKTKYFRGEVKSGR